MPQLRWTLLCLGVLFVILLAWIERRRQRRQGFSDTSHVEKDPAHGHGPGGQSAETTPGTMFREPVLTLPEMRAAREASPAQDLPIVEIEDDSLNARRIETHEPLMDPPTLSLPVVDSGPEIARRRTGEPTVSDFEAVKVPRLDTPALRASTPPKPGTMRIDLGDTSSLKPEANRFDLADTEPPEPEARRFDLSDTPPPKPGANRINLADTPVGTGDSEEHAFNEAVFGDPSLGEDISPAPDPDEPHIRTDVISESGPTFGASPSERPSRTQFLGGAAAPDNPSGARIRPEDFTPIADPIVEWPPDDQRRVVAIRLVANPPERLAGRALRLALASEGFVLGKFQIFHKPDDAGRAVLSAANLSKPGTFDLNTMDSQRYGGLSLFTVLPGPKAPLKAFEDLLMTARNLNERLNGALQDERGGPLTPTRIASMRDSLGTETPS
jgi:hypothetical protein